jgi:putative ABC transport system ATP-binding protein
LKYFDEISFSQKDTPEEEHDFIITEGSGDRFSIRRLNNETFELINNSPAGHRLYVDAFCLEPGDKIPLESKSVFIYNHSPSDDDTVSNTSFIFGFDPVDIEIWKIKETGRGCSVSARNFSKKFMLSEGKYVGVEDINFEIRPAELVGIYGNSGIGKSVLIESLISPKDKGLKKTSKFEIYDGELFINKRDTSLSAELVAYLPQKIQFPKLAKCRELLKLGMVDRHNITPNSTKYIEDILKLCTLSPEILNEKYGKLSGGQQRRLALAMLLLDKRIRLLIADEPTSGLDIANEMEIMRTFRKLSRSMGITVIVVTHAIAALQMFDRVMVLRKADDKRGASMSFNTLWCKEAFPELLKDTITQDAGRIAFLSNPTSLFQMPSCNQLISNWPFCFGKYPHPAEETILDKLIRVSIAPFKWLSIFFARYVFKQYSRWAYESLKLIWREKKFLGVFVILAICCALSIQIGAGNGVSGNESLLSLTSLCSPWLCATYAAIFVSGLLPTFAWESFSGLRTRCFTAGILSGLMLPCILISLVFTLSLFWRLDNNWIGKQIYTYLKVNGHNQILRFFISEENENEYIDKCLNNENWRANSFFVDIPPQYNLGKSELGINGQGKLVYRDPSTCNYNEIEDNRDRTYSVVIKIKDVSRNGNTSDYPQMVSVYEDDGMRFLPKQAAGEYTLSGKKQNNYPYYEHKAGNRTFFLFHVKDSSRNWWGIAERMFDDTQDSLRATNFIVSKSSDLDWEESLLQGRYVHKVPMISPLAFFARQWFFMAILSFIGVAMGTAAIAFFRDIKAATICLVIMLMYGKEASNRKQ